MLYSTTYNSPIGIMQIVAEPDAIVGIYFDGQMHFKENLKEIPKKEDTGLLRMAVSWLDDYFAKKNPPINLPLKLEGTPFRLAVWEELKKIPYGQTVTYGDIAKTFQKLGKPKMSAQAVGNAVSHNPISIMVPCHRVVGVQKSAGAYNLVGYAGGLDKKKYLLTLEGMDESLVLTPNS